MVRKFAGSNLFTLALEKLSLSKKIPKDHIYVAVGEKPLFDIAINFPFHIWERSKESCDSTNDPNVPDSLTLLYEWHEYLQTQGFTHVVLVSACNPLLPIEVIDQFYEEFTISELDGMFSVTKKHNFYWSEDGKVITDWKGMTLMNTRKVDPIYEGAHCLYGSRLDFIKDECWMGNTSPPTPHLFEVSELEATDIDTLADFEHAEILYLHYQDKPAMLAKMYLDPNRNKTGRDIPSGAALAMAHDQIKKAIEIAYYEGKGDMNKVREMLKDG